MICYKHMETKALCILMERILNQTQESKVYSLTISKYSFFILTDFKLIVSD